LAAEDLDEVDMGHPEYIFQRDSENILGNIKLTKGRRSYELNEEMEMMDMGKFEKMEDIKSDESFDERSTDESNVLYNKLGYRKRDGEVLSSDQNDEEDLDPEEGLPFHTHKDYIDKTFVDDSEEEHEYNYKVEYETEDEIPEEEYIMSWLKKRDCYRDYFEQENKREDDFEKNEKKENYDMNEIKERNKNFLYGE
jgi:hypothetical protein